MKTKPEKKPKPLYYLCTFKYEKNYSIPWVAPSVLVAKQMAQEYTIDCVMQNSIPPMSLVFLNCMDMDNPKDFHKTKEPEYDLIPFVKLAEHNKSGISDGKPWETTDEFIKRMKEENSNAES